MDAINDGLNTNERTSNIKTKFYKPNDAYCSQNESEMCCRTTLINETATEKACFELEDYECLLPNECDTGKEIIKEFRKVFKSLYFCRNGAFWAGQPVDFNFANKRILLLRLFFICHGKNNGILFPKLFWLTVGKNCFSDWEIFLKFQAEGREFANWLRSLEQFIQIVKLQNNFWNRTFF